MKKIILALTSCVVFSSCSAIQPARMVQPVGFDASEVVPVSGVSGWRKGQYVAGAFRGSFFRSSDRLAFFGDFIEELSGKVEFTLAGPKIEGALEINCRMRERAINIGIMNFKPERMAYRCAFTHNGNSIPARFEIQENRRGLAGNILKEERRGEIALDRVILQIVSVHQLHGTPLVQASPIGYRFELDGVAVGSVEINGKPVIRILPGTDEATRRAITAASIALGVFWDPADTRD